MEEWRRDDSWWWVVQGEGSSVAAATGGGGGMVSLSASRGFGRGGREEAVRICG